MDSANKTLQQRYEMRHFFLCSQSEITTNEAPPEQVWHQPATVAINTSSVLVLWDKPLKPNGIITEYRLMRRQLIKNNASLDVSMNRGFVRCLIQYLTFYHLLIQWKTLLKPWTHQNDIRISIFIKIL